MTDPTPDAPQTPPDWRALCAELRDAYAESQAIQLSEEAYLIAQIQIIENKYREVLRPLLDRLAEINGPWVGSDHGPSPLLARVDAALATPPAAPDTTREQVKAAIADALGGGAYDCLRVWSAWGIGTMGQDDFSPIAEDDDRVAEIADAAIAALATPPVAPLEPPGPAIPDEVRKAFSELDRREENLRRFRDLRTAMDAEPPAPAPTAPDHIPDATKMVPAATREAGPLPQAGAGIDGQELLNHYSRAVAARAAQLLEEQPAAAAGEVQP